MENLMSCYRIYSLAKKNERKLAQQGMGVWEAEGFSTK